MKNEENIRIGSMILTAGVLISIFVETVGAKMQFLNGSSASMNITYHETQGEFPVTV